MQRDAALRGPPAQSLTRFLDDRADKRRIHD
jgi:hypothetical protein